MKKFHNFKKRLKVLKTVDYDVTTYDEIYRRGVVCQFYITF